MTIKPRIFVQIASYRDAECQHTLKDMFDKATHPERVFAGICHQVIPEEDADLFKIITRPGQVRINLVNAKESKGACWARHMTQSLWQGEEYTLQIDSHMRFEPGWDETMLEMLYACDSEKPVISTYPPGYEPPDKIAGRWATSLHASHFESGGVFIPKAISHALEVVIEKPNKGAFLAAGFIFASSDFIKELPYDPYLYFIGEEITLAVRAYTKGWDIFYPNKPVIYHNYTPAERPGRKTHFADNSEWHLLNDLSYKRVKHLLGTETSTDPDVIKELDVYGLGTVRSLYEYQDYSGVNFKAKTISENAKIGVFGTGTLEDSGKPKIFVQIASYRDPECQHTVKDLFEKATYPNRINVGICWQFIHSEDSKLFEVPSPRPRQMKIIEIDARETKGVCWARSLVQKLWTGEEYSLQIDSHMRFEPGWDENLIEMLGQCQLPKPLLTAYPNAYHPPHETPTKFPSIIHAGKFADNNILTVATRGATESEALQPIPGAFISANYLFASSQIIAELPYDPNFFFTAIEISLAARAYTHGWNIFHPNKPVIYHRYERDGRRTVFEDNPFWYVADEIGCKRARHLLGTEISTDPNVIKDLDIYNLGKARSLTAYQKYSGVNFKTKTISQKAKNGAFKVQKFTTNKPKIFVQISSYKDPECPYTVRDLFTKATYPERIFIGICQQYDKKDDDFSQIPTAYLSQVRIIKKDSRKSQGANWARSLAQSLCKDEEYTLQIDSHMRFDPGWDETLLEMMAKLNRPKSAITIMAPHYDPPDTLYKYGNSVPRIRVSGMAHEIDPAIVHLAEKFVDPTDSRNGFYPTPFVICNFLFAATEMFRNVPIDPYIYFSGDEINYSARLWTHDYNIYQPDKAFVYHHWLVANNKHEKPYKSRFDQRTDDSLKRNQYLLKIKKFSLEDPALKDLESYGLGKKRPIKSFWEYAGLDLINHSVKQESLDGYWNVKLLDNS